MVCECEPRRRRSTRERRVESGKTNLSQNPPILGGKSWGENGAWGPHYFPSPFSFLSHFLSYQAGENVFLTPFSLPIFFPLPFSSHPSRPLFPIVAFEFLRLSCLNHAFQFHHTSLCPLNCHGPHLTSQSAPYLVKWAINTNMSFFVLLRHWKPEKLDYR